MTAGIHIAASFSDLNKLNTKEFALYKTNVRGICIAGNVFLHK